MSLYKCMLPYPSAHKESNKGREGGESCLPKLGLGGEGEAA